MRVGEAMFCISGIMMNCIHIYGSGVVVVLLVLIVNSDNILTYVAIDERINSKGLCLL